MPNVQTKAGDATSPRPKSAGIVILHVVNNRGKWGGGFVAALDKMSAIPKASYLSWAKDHSKNIPLGEVSFVETQRGLFIAQMCAQADTVDYKALEACLKFAFQRALRLQYEVHIPAGIGSGRAGGDKAKIHALIEACAADVEKNSRFAKWVKEHTDQQLELDITLWELPDLPGTAATDSADDLSAAGDDISKLGV